MNKTPAKRVLVTCPPMLRMIREGGLASLMASTGWDFECPDIVQTLSESALIEKLPDFDGWIIGDDPASHRVLEAGKTGRLRAIVKWGVGVDNVDFAAAQALGLPVANTPRMFGREVADVAMGYVIALARETFLIDRGVRAGSWPKPCGISLFGRTVGTIGLGDIGRNFARRAHAADMRVIAYDPFYKPDDGAQSGGPVDVATWPERLNECDFLVFCCALTPQNRHMLNRETLAQAKPGTRVINVARGPLIETGALVAALASGHVHSAALDVLETEPLSADSPLRGFEQVVFGSHNASNTRDAVYATSERALRILQGFFGESGDAPAGDA
ncbi:MAG: phosphoglycerate dehydrogenase [Deltaproteobacteria bacterium]|nr:phosphoglycerate dehydrogenase [Deltaproteobacteria bacterium]